MSSPAHSQPFGPLAGAVNELCLAVAASSTGVVRKAVMDVQTGLAEPLRVAIIGRVSSGKSTLVNALLKRRVAPTDFGECTRVVTVFRFDVSERVELHGASGYLRSMPLAPNGGLPADSLSASEEVTRLEVFLSNDALRE